MANDKLPETTQDRIKADADKWSDDQLRYVYAVEKLAYIEGATAYAQWKVRYDELNDELQKFKETARYLTVKCDELGVNNHHLQAQAQRMADALQRIIDHTEHEDYGLTNESCPVCIAMQALKQFKNGTKGKEVENG